MENNTNDKQRPMLSTGIGPDGANSLAGAYKVYSHTFTFELACAARRVIGCRATSCLCQLEKTAGGNMWGRC